MYVGYGGAPELAGLERVSATVSGGVAQMREGLDTLRLTASPS